MMLEHAKTIAELQAQPKVKGRRLEKYSSVLTALSGGFELTAVTGIILCLMLMMSNMWQTAGVPVDNEEVLTWINKVLYCGCAVAICGAVVGLAGLLLVKKDGYGLIVTELAVILFSGQLVSFVWQLQLRDSIESAVLNGNIIGTLNYLSVYNSLTIIAVVRLVIGIVPTLMLITAGIKRYRNED